MTLVLSVAAINTPDRWHDFEILALKANHYLQQENNGTGDFVKLQYLTALDFQKSEAIPLGHVRNHGLDTLGKNNIVWFLDNDVLLTSRSIVDVYYRTKTLPNDSLLILESINVRSERANTEIDAVFPQVWSTRIKELRWFEKFKAVLSTRSIEIVCSGTEFRFPTDRGVGVDNRVGAENVFISHWMKSGKIFATCSDVPSVAHIDKSSGQKKTPIELYKSGHVAELGGIIFGSQLAGRALNLLFLLKKFVL